MSALLPRAPSGCPFLLLAPMEGVGDRSFRVAMASIGGFDEAVTDFLRVPANAHVPSLGCRFDPHETLPIPIAVQVMGSDLSLMAEMASYLEGRGAHRIDINCGCPSNTVTGRGAGSSLLKDPTALHEVARAVVAAVNIPVTVKMRIGFDDTSLFEENILAAEESGISYITLHPRTKADGYGPPARWEYIARAKELLKIPVVGNGDILTVKDALRMLSETGCDALMIGRGAVINPFLFHQIKAHFSSQQYRPCWEDLEAFFASFIKELPEAMTARVKVNKLKQLMSFQFKLTEGLSERRQAVLSYQAVDMQSFLLFALNELKNGRWEEAFY
jgi:nifR3 family TIM-barrel protein